jgi:hypothetical protein
MDHPRSVPFRALCAAAAAALAASLAVSAGAPATAKDTPADDLEPAASEPRLRPRGRALYRLRPSATGRSWESYGNYDPDAGESHGYVRDRKGRFTINDFPGARVGGNYKNNNRGQVVGNYSVENRIVTQHAAELGDLVGRRCAGRHPGRRA